MILYYPGWYWCHHSAITFSTVEIASSSPKWHSGNVLGQTLHVSLRTGPYAPAPSKSCTQGTFCLCAVRCRADTKHNPAFYLSLVKHTELLNKWDVTAFIYHWNTREKSSSHLYHLFLVEKGEWRITIPSWHCEADATKQTDRQNRLCPWHLFLSLGMLLDSKLAALIQASVLDTPPMTPNSKHFKTICILSHYWVREKGAIYCKHQHQTLSKIFMALD